MSTEATAVQQVDLATRIQVLAAERDGRIASVRQQVADRVEPLLAALEPIRRFHIDIEQSIQGLAWNVRLIVRLIRRGSPLVTVYVRPDGYEVWPNGVTGQSVALTFEAAIEPVAPLTLETAIERVAVLTYETLLPRSETP